MADPVSPKRSRASTPVLVDEPRACQTCAALRTELASVRAELTEARTAIAALQARRG